MKTDKKLEETLQKVSHVSKIVMEHKGFKAKLMRAERLKDQGCAHGLPPGEPIDVISTDCLPGCPKEWVTGHGSYVCPVDSENGLWFDWTMNDSLNTSVLTSVKGMNPLTGKKLEDVSLASYENKCPVHDIDFKGDSRLCSKCEYEWPTQNYVCSPNTLWLDGFRQPDGSVRQFFFSEDEKRDIASLVIGKKNTIPAFGFVFYEPKEQRIPPEVQSVHGMYKNMGLGSWVSEKNSYYYHNSAEYTVAQCTTAEEKTSGIIGADVVLGNHTKGMPPQAKGKQQCMILRSAGSRQIKPATVSVGAGAEIRQDIQKDSLKVSDWKSEPSAMIRLYFVFADQFEKIVSKGVEDLKGQKDGFLKGLPVG